jgi:lysozyme
VTRFVRSPRLVSIAGALCVALLSATVAGSESPKVESASAGVGVGAESSTYMAGKRRAQGIDVSHWQGRIGWRKVARDGVDFAIAKATEGYGWVDRSYRRNHARARLRGVRITAYHYARPDRSPWDAIREADFFIDHARLRPGDLLPALDLETTGGLNRRNLRTWTLHWLQRVERRLGVKPMIYTSPGFWSSALGDTRLIARRGYEVVWVAHWDTYRPRVPADGWNGNGWTFWQWTSRGRVDGVRGFVDRNWYNGKALRSLTIRSLRRAAD